MSIQTEVPGVRAAVEHMLELAERMREDSFGFNENDISNIEKVIEAVQELDKERSKLHDILETETIKSSVLRHRLHFLPAGIDKEIVDAVNSARQSNAVVLNNLQKDLENVNENTKFLEERHKILTEENTVLTPERDVIKQQHEEIISQLNQRMAEKASMQITLNETRDKVRQTNQTIVEIEDSILQLKDDLITERHESRTEKKRLQEEIKETTEKTKEQREENMVKKKQLDSLHEKLIDSQGQLSCVKRSLYRYETSRAKLDAQETKLTEQLMQKKKSNEELRKQGLAIVNEDVRRQKEFEQEEANLKAKLKRLESEILRERSKQDEVETKKLELHVEHEDRMKIKNADAEQIEGLNAQLQTVKRNLAMKAEEVGKMNAENADMTDKLARLEESHVTVLATMNKQIEDYREQLSKERKERKEIQERKNSLHHDMESSKAENVEFLQLMNNKIQMGKQRQTALSHESVELQEELKVENNLIEKLEQEVTVAQKQYERMFHMKQDEIQTCQSEIAELQSKITDIKSKMEEELPKFEVLEENFGVRKSNYDQMRKDIIALKGKKLALEDANSKTKQEMDRTRAPQQQLRTDLKSKRGAILEQMSTQGDEIQTMEKQIYNGVCKLRTVEEENKKLKTGCAKLEKAIADLHRNMEENERTQVRLKAELETLRGDLQTGWIENQDMQKDFAERDEKIITALGVLLNKTENRETIVADISNKLEGELSMLSGFLDNLASRRPKGKKSPNRVEGRDTIKISKRKNKSKKQPSDIKK